MPKKAEDLIRNTVRLSSLPIKLPVSVRWIIDEFNQYRDKQQTRAHRDNIRIVHFPGSETAVS